MSYFSCCILCAFILSFNLNTFIEILGTMVTKSKMWLHSQRAHSLLYTKVIVFFLV